MYYVCYKPDKKSEPGIVAHIYHASVPRFFARIEKLGVAEPISELGYRGINIVFSYGLEDEAQEDYVMIVENNLIRLVIAG